MPAGKEARVTKHDAERKVRILDFIAATLRARGYPPSVREIAAGAGLGDAVIDAVLNEEAVTRLVAAADAELREYGVTGVPLFIIGSAGDEAERLAVSRATLREAIAALRQAGLVETRRGRGGGHGHHGRPDHRGRCAPRAPARRAQPARPSASR